MKNTLVTLLLTSAAGSLALAPTLSAGTPKRASAPVVIAIPAVPDGSNYSRAPFLAFRPQDDALPPNGQAFDETVPPNTPASTPAPFAAPPPAFAILQPTVAPGLLPTGRPVIAAAATLDAPQVQTLIQNTAGTRRDEVIDSVRVRVRESQVAMREYRRSRGEMSPEGRAAFDAADAEARAREKSLEKSLRSAGRGAEQNWDEKRSQVAAEYQAYVAAVARIDALAGNAPATPARQ
ncbi:hypothetical protein [Opitutus sp. ER46]|uniref:hypothetical protein n=1 Tax=Opitutus sp. ER46 TaxID=2161864 RepID=UPI000D30C0FC|nr:hypothetical protein [Opitutus sp. ER46]PTX91762.1 hypothetical protein DB354_18045 [Opitutus sp. ER46]